jgi:hypothetical protein
MQFLETDKIEFKPLAKMACRITEYRQPNRFFAGLLNGIFLSVPVWAILCTLMVWMF